MVLQDNYSDQILPILCCVGQRYGRVVQGGEEKEVRTWGLLTDFLFRTFIKSQLKLKQICKKKGEVTDD